MGARGAGSRFARGARGAGRKTRHLCDPVHAAAPCFVAVGPGVERFRLMGNLAACVSVLQRILRCASPRALATLQERRRWESDILAQSGADKDILQGLHHYHEMIGWS